MSFEGDLRRFAEKTNQTMKEVVHQAVILAAQGVVMGSPVGNADLWKVKPPPGSGYVGGRFRANWRFGVGIPDLLTTADTDKTGAMTLQKIVAAVAKEEANQVFFISNSLPYAQRLEFGWSTQAPQGMVRLTVADLPRRLEAYAASLKRNPE